MYHLVSFALRVLHPGYGTTGNQNPRRFRRCGTISAQNAALRGIPAILNGRRTTEHSTFSGFKGRIAHTGRGSGVFNQQHSKREWNIAAPSPCGTQASRTPGGRNFPRLPLSFPFACLFSLSGILQGLDNPIKPAEIHIRRDGAVRPQNQSPGIPRRGAVLLHGPAGECLDFLLGAAV